MASINELIQKATEKLSDQQLREALAMAKGMAVTNQLQQGAAR